MAEAYVVEPDVGFINDVAQLGGADLKKCYQCATCSVACPISPDTRPFPRKEMIAASWGLKDKLVGNPDIWLCHNCGDCTTLCPRGAKPGDVLSAMRIYCVQEYATPKSLAKMVNDPGKLPVLLAIPTILILVAGIFFNLIGLDWFHLNPGSGQHWQADFINNLMVDVIMVPTFTAAVLIFGLGLMRFVSDMHANALKMGDTDQKRIDPIGLGKAFIRVLPTIATHRKFSECSENESRATPHMMVLFGFIALFIVTACFFIAEWGLHIEGPYPQVFPIKWLGNLGGIALVIGSAVLMMNRFTNKEAMSSYTDWYLLWLAFLLGVTGLGTEMLRLGHLMVLSNIVYFAHLVLVWALFAYTPFSKLAHIAYRTVAMTYHEYIGRT